MTEQEAYRSMLLQKKELLFKFLRLSNDTVLTEPASEKNAENYIELVEARGEIIDRLKKLESEMSGAQPPGMSEEAALLEREMKVMADQIARLELDIHGKASGIMTRLRKELWNINDRKKVSGGEYTPGLIYQRNA